jgi:bifunctional UDP-N-acetylglucosamine pyrophosphorylase/glucosamine-1-phosphate N-acetyltransferase
MKSDIPKVLHKLAGKPLLGHVIDAARKLHPEKICIVYGHGGERLLEAFAAQNDLCWVLQEPQLGTGHAVQQAIEQIDHSDTTLILYGDVPLTPVLVLGRLFESVSENALGLLTAELDNPAGYGRIVRDASGNVRTIVEHKDATEKQLAIKEINTGIMALPNGKLKEWLQQIRNDNAQQEYYLTDVIGLAVKDGFHIHTQHAFAIEDVMGVNSRQQLIELERYLQKRTAISLYEHGVTIRDPERFDLRGDLKVGQDVEIDVNVILEGNVQIGNNVNIESNCVIRNSIIDSNVQILTHCVIENSHIKSGCIVGPFARLRPDSVLQENAKIGNFVEIKKSSIGFGSKVNHLSYVGDAEVGALVNIGAGTIVCNYDGANKHQTVIEDGVFIGSDTQLVAPVKIGKNATIGAGSTITKNVPAETLALSRSRQKTIEGWERPVKKNK